LWVEHVERVGGLRVAPHGSRRPLRLIALDDASVAARARDNVQRLLVEERVDVLLGPYSSGLTLAVAPLAAAQGKLLWNHGGASDALVDRRWRHVVSVPAPASDYFRDLPWLVKERDPHARSASIIYRSGGTFADHVRRGMEHAARAAGFQAIHATPVEAPIRDARAVLAEALALEPDLLVGAGAFDDDVALARARARLATRASVAFVAAGVDAFYDEVGTGAEGIIGPSQWEPAIYEHPATGPASGWFCVQFRARFRYAPGYIAAQAYATGIMIAECIARAATLEDEALLRVASGLETSTLYGGFRLDPESLRQIGHRILLVQWHGGHRVLLQRHGHPVGEG
jgi:branched-chain amino acid transport system substrate-binding protein